MHSLTSHTEIEIDKQLATASSSAGNHLAFRKQLHKQSVNSGYMYIVPSPSLNCALIGYLLTWACKYSCE